MVTFVVLLVLCHCCIGFTSDVFKTSIEDLEVENDERWKEGHRFIRSVIAPQDKNNLNTSDYDEKSIQTPLLQRSADNASILNAVELLAHADQLANISLMSIPMFGVNWSLADICIKLPYPMVKNKDLRWVSEVLQKLIPCMIITPLDCFWEGSKPLGPFPPVKVPVKSIQEVMTFLDPSYKNGLSWLTFNPNNILELLEGGLEDAVPGLFPFFKRTGITTGYTMKPCLDPWDSQCPQTAPNYHKNTTDDYGAILSDGCKGFATKLLLWPEDFILGGVERDEHGKIVKATALQSTVLIAQADAVYKRFANLTGDVEVAKPGLDPHDWTPEAANALLQAWQRNFIELIHHSAFNANQTARNDSTPTLGSTHHSFSVISVPSNNNTASENPPPAEHRSTSQK